MEPAQYNAIVRFIRVLVSRSPTRRCEPTEVIVAEILS